MARIDTLSNFLTDVADAIRGKKGTADLITVEDFDTEIAELPTEGEIIPEVATEAAMDTLLQNINYGKKYKYIGQDGKYVHDAVYIVNHHVQNGDMINNVTFCPPSADITTHTSLISCSIGSKLIGFISLRSSNYTIDNTWHIEGISDVITASGTSQFMVVVSKIATSTQETLTVTQDPQQRMYINMFELPSSAIATFDGFQYQSTGDHITLSNLSGKKLIGITTPLWSVATPYRAWQCDYAGAYYFGASDFNYNTQQRQGVFWLDILDTTTVTFSNPAGDTATIAACISIDNYVPIVPPESYVVYYDFDNFSHFFSSTQGLTKLPYIKPASPLRQIAPNIRQIAYLDVYISGIARDCTQLEKIDYINIDLELASLAEMFYGCAQLVTLPDFSKPDNVTNTNYMFYNCSKLVSLPPSFNTRGVLQMSNMFNNCYQLTSIANIDTSYATNMNSMLLNCRSLTTLPATFDTSSAQNVSNLFYGCQNLTTVPTLNLLNVAPTGLTGLFQFCGLNSWPTLILPDNLTSYAYVFRDTKITNASVDYNFSKTNNFEQLFYDCTSLQEVDFSQAQAPDNSVTSINARYMFYYCSALNKINLSIFDLDKFTTYNNMFDRVPANCLIIVKDTASKTWMNTKFSRMTNVVTNEEYLESITE